MSRMLSFWRTEAKNFVKINLERFLNTNKTLGFFGSDPRILHLFAVRTKSHFIEFHPKIVLLARCYHHSQDQILAVAFIIARHVGSQLEHEMIELFSSDLCKQAYIMLALRGDFIW